MFTSARLKITFWYLVVVMLIAVGFSGAIFQISNAEIERFAKLRTFEAREVLLGKGVDLSTQTVVLSRLEDELILEARISLRRNLYIINLVILLLASVGGYWLAGMTLDPIRRTLSSQEQFVSDVSHELKTPLTAMKLSLEVALRQGKISTTQAKDLLAANLTDINDLHVLVESMLTLAHKPILQERQVALTLGDIMQNCEKKLQKKLQNRALAIGGNYTNFIGISVPRVLEQVMLILLDNASKYALENTSIEVNFVPSDSRQKLTVKNWGRGIKKENLSQIGNRFFREDNSRNSEGHGLGLAIAKKILKSIDGELNVRSKEGEWVEFEVSVSML